MFHSVLFLHNTDQQPNSAIRTEKGTVSLREKVNSAHGPSTTDVKELFHWLLINFSKVQQICLLNSYNGIDQQYSG